MCNPEAIDWIHEYDCIAIDEGHFFSDLEDFTERVANEGKIVVVAALDADFRRKVFNFSNIIIISLSFLYECIQIFIHTIASFSHLLKLYPSYHLLKELQS